VSVCEHSKLDVGHDDDSEDEPFNRTLSPSRRRRRRRRRRRFII